MGGNQVETESSKQAREASLGQSLVTARERRGLSREAVVQQTHIPARYVQMLEDDDYRRISDQLYLLPFLRKYASFLDIDQDETAMRLVREVLRLDNSPSPVRLEEPLDDSRRHSRRNWTKPILFSGLVAVIIGASIAQSHHNDTDTITAPKIQPVQAAVTTPSLSASKGNSALAAQSASAASVGRSDSSASQQRPFGTRASGRSATQSISQVMAMPVATPATPGRPLLQRKTRGARQVPNP